MEDVDLVFEESALRAMAKKAVDVMQVSWSTFDPQNSLLETMYDLEPVAMSALSSSMKP